MKLYVSWHSEMPPEEIGTVSGEGYARVQQQELIPGTNRDHSLSQFFTPPRLAAKLVEWAGVRDVERRDFGIHFRPMRVLEPSAGNGAIVRELVKAGAWVTAVEIDQRYAQELFEAGAQDRWYGMDFLKAEPTAAGLSNLDLVCGNFPFHLDLTGAFTLHALKFAPRVVAIYPSNFYFSEKRIEFWKQVRPTRIANIARRPWEGATDYVALELVMRSKPGVTPIAAQQCSIEFWTEAWD